MNLAKGFVLFVIVGTSCQALGQPALFSIESRAASSDLIIAGKAISSDELAIDSILKGEYDSERVQITRAYWRDEAGKEWEVSTSNTSLTKGKRYVLFLSALPEGGYRLARNYLSAVKFGDNGLIHQSDIALWEVRFEKYIKEVRNIVRKQKENAPQ